MPPQESIAHARARRSLKRGVALTRGSPGTGGTSQSPDGDKGVSSLSPLTGDAQNPLAYPLCRCKKGPQCVRVTDCRLVIRFGYEWTTLRSDLWSKPLATVAVLRMWLACTRTAAV